MTKINKNNTALWIGRFQPFHLGHVYILKKILSSYSFISIVIGSVQEDYTFKNPLTSKERKRILENALVSLGVSKKQYKITLLDDITTNSKWPEYIKKNVGSFDRVVTSSPLTKILFEDNGFSVEEHFLYNRKHYSGTEIRHRMLRGKDWTSLVSPSTLIDLKEIDLEYRIKEIIRSDNPYT